MIPEEYSKEMVVCCQCGSSHWRKLTSQWRCANGHVFLTQSGFPDFSKHTNISHHDRNLRDRLYNGLLGRYYNFMMPLLSLAARPVKQSLTQWFVFSLAWLGLLGLVFSVLAAFYVGYTGFSLMLLLILLTCGMFFFRHPYLFWLLILAVPVRLQIAMTPYNPAENFSSVHKRWLKLMPNGGKLQVLDVSTGTCNSLLRHGWTSLNADYHGVDLATTMLLQGANNAAQSGVPIQLYVADAQQLPFSDASVDLVLNYGALNSYQDQGKALAEMARVLKPGGFLVCLDEQLYNQTTPLQALYFEKVLASHDKVMAFPAAAVPVDLELLELHQIYQFYFLALMRKRAA